MYAQDNPKSKKQLKQWIEDGREIMAFQPGPFGQQAPRDGWVSLEGPHYPKPHRWYARARLEGGIIKELK